MAELPFGDDTAQRLMKIAEDEKLANAAHARYLPPSWYTLYELTKLTEHQLEDGIAARLIRPDMDRKDVAAIRAKDWHEKRPLLLEPEFDALAADIAANGVREAIWRHRDGSIIDGRNRWLAAQKVGIEPPSNTYAGPDEGLVAFVVSLNLRRRQLSTDQKGAIAAEMANMPVGRPSAEKASIDAFSVTDAEAAKLFNISEPTVERAKALLRRAPDLHEKVKSGELKAGAARRELKRREREAAIVLNAPRDGDAPAGRLRAEME